MLALKFNFSSFSLIASLADLSFSCISTTDIFCCSNIGCGLLSSLYWIIVWFVLHKTVLSKFNVVACSLSLISLSIDEKTRSDAAFVVGVLFASSLSSSDGFCRFLQVHFPFALRLLIKSCP